MYKKSSAKIWRKFDSRYSLKGSQCQSCRQKYYPARSVCQKCLSTKLAPYSFKHSGKLVTWSQVHAGSQGYEEYTPYIVAIVELEGGQRLTTQIVDVDASELKPGQKLEAVFRQIYKDGDEGIIHYGLKFRPKS